MKKKLRIASIALAMMTILNLTACEQSKAQNTSTTTTTTQQTTVIEAQNTTTAPTEITTSPITTEQTTTIKPKIIKKTGTTTTTKATVKKNTPKSTTKATTTTTTTKAQGLTDEDYQWVLNEALKYIETLPKAKIDKTAEGFGSEGTYVNYSKTKEDALKRVIDNIDSEYNDWAENVNSVGMNVKLCKDSDNDYYYAVRSVYS